MTRVGCDFNEIVRSYFFRFDVSLFFYCSIRAGMRAFFLRFVWFALNDGCFFFFFFLFFTSKWIVDFFRLHFVTSSSQRKCIILDVEFAGILLRFRFFDCVHKNTNLYKNFQSTKRNDCRFREKEKNKNKK